jgi:hypothetical protein
MGCFSIAVMLNSVMIALEMGLVEMMDENIYMVICMILADVFSLGIGLLLVIQLRLLYLNITSYEMGIDSKKRPFKRKTCMRNIQVVFGPKRWYWLSPLHHPHTDSARRSS